MPAAGPQNLVELAISWGLPRFSSAYWAQRFLGAVGSVPCDMLNEGCRLAVRAGMLYDTNPAPPDASHEQPGLSLELLGADSLLPLADAADTAGLAPPLALHARLRERWDHHALPARDRMIAELTRAGYLVQALTVPGDAAAPADSHTDFWARMWVDFGTPPGHPLSGGATAGAIVVDTTRLGPFQTQAQAEWYFALRAIVERTRPAQWVVWDYRFDMGATTISLMGHYRYLDPDYVYEA